MSDRSVADLFYRQPRLCALAIGFIVVAGLAAIETLPRQEDPALSRRFAEITTAYPGATAERVEALVTDPIEEKLQELHEVRTLESVSRTGASVLVVELEEEYDESRVDEVWSRVRDKLSDIAPSLPEGAGTPDFDDKTTTAVTLLVGFTWPGTDTPPLALMTRLARELESRLRVLPGTKETRLHGQAVEEVRVEVDPIRLAQLGLDAPSLARAIASADSRRPAGLLVGPASTMPIEVEGELSSVDRIRRIPLRSAFGERLLRVGDVARVQRGWADPPPTIAVLAGDRGIAVSATMLPGHSRVDRWAQRAREVVDAFAAEVPAGIGYRVLFDQSVYTDQRIATLLGNLLIGAGLVVLVLLVAMGVRSALIVSTALPLSLLMALGFMNAFGVPLHQTSITGLIIALGLLIDNAIVAVDEYELRIRRGASTAQAIREVFRDLLVPLGASTLTTVIAFMPILLMPGPGGEFVGPIAAGVALTVTSSFLLSMTLVLAFAGWFMPSERFRREERSQGSFLRHGWSSPRLTALYRRALVTVLERPVIGVGVSIVLPVIGFAVGRTLPEQFFPANDRNQFQVQIALPSHASIETTHEAALRARALIEAHDEVVETHFFVGELPPQVYYNMIGNESVPSFTGAFVTTRSAEATERLLPRLQRELIDAFPEATALALPFEQGPPVQAPIQARLVGPDLDVLREQGEALRRLLAQTRAVTYTRASLRGGRPKLLLRADEDAARLAGLALAPIADQLDGALQGVRAGRVLEATEELAVRVRLRSRDRASLTSLGATRLQPPAGGAPAPHAGSQQRPGALPGLPLESITDVALRPELAAIARRNGERINAVEGFLVPYALIASSLEDFRQRLEASGFALPHGYRMEFGGEAEERGEALASLASFAVPLFVVMAGAIVLTFNSFRFASIIFAVAFLSIGLALLGVWIFGYPLGFVAIVGTMGLAGLAVNDAIVVLNALRLDARAAHGEPAPTAEVVIDATRHILATTFTTIGGFTPLIVFGGRFWPPMATAIAGGVLGASILALFFVPALFVATRRASERRLGARAATAALSDAEAADR